MFLIKLISFQLSPIERYAMQFVEQTGVNWAQQIKAVEMEIEQQKREWEEKHRAQLQQEELERQKNEKEENELLTYSREDALNKVNIKSSSKSNRKPAANNINNNNTTKSNSSGNKRNFVKSENANQTKSPIQGKNSNNSNGAQNGIGKKSVDEITPKRNTRNTSKNQSVVASEIKVNSRIIPRRALSRKSDKSTSSSKRTNTIRSTSESTRSTSMSRQTSSVPDDSNDSECSLDVMIDSNDVNDSDSNSNTKAESNFDSTSQDDDTVLNDDSTITDETTIGKNSDKVTSSPRTRSRGTVKINLWSLDDSPILPPKRQKVGSQKSTSELNQLKADFGVKECKVSVADIHIKPTKPSPSQARIQKRLMSSAKNNHTLDSWVQKVPEPLNRSKTTDAEEIDEIPSKQTTRATRRNTNINKTL